MTFENHLTSALYALGFSVNQGQDIAEAAAISVSVIHAKGDQRTWVRVELDHEKELLLVVDPVQIIKSADRWK
jgi:hypothetical protein